MHCDGKRPAIDGFARHLLPEQRDLERAPPRCQKCSQHVVDNPLEEISQPHVSEAALRLGRPRRKDRQSAYARVLDGCSPERRLSDPGFALQHESSGASLRLVDEGVEGGEFGLSADDLEHHAAERS